MTSNERLKLFRQNRKKLHKCIICGNQDEKTMSGKSCCAKCLEKQKLRQKKCRVKLSAKKTSIYEIVRFASAEGLSYGKYVAKCRDESR